MLAAAPPQEQKQMLGERLFPLIQRMFPDLAGKITGMLLEIDNAELVHMLEDQNSLKGKVDTSSWIDPGFLTLSHHRLRRQWLCCRLTRARERRSKQQEKKEEQEEKLRKSKSNQPNVQIKSLNTCTAAVATIHLLT